MTRALVLLSSLLLAAPAVAQMNFEGLDLGGKKKKKPPKEDKKKDPDEKKDNSSSEVKIPEGGLDLTKPPDKEDKKTGSSPTMSFEGVDVSGKAADRQKLDAAVKEFKNENYEAAAIASYELMNDPKMAALATESQYLLAKSL